MITEMFILSWNIQIQGHRKRFFHFGASTRKKPDQRPSTPQQTTTLQPSTGALVLYNKASGTCTLIGIDETK